MIDFSAMLAARVECTGPFAGGLAAVLFRPDRMWPDARVPRLRRALGAVDGRGQARVSGDRFLVEES